DISQIELDSFLNQLNQARQADSINTFTQSYGHIGVYCEGGIYRSRQMGNLLNSLGFVFADPACIRGETISNLLNKLMVDSEVKIGRLRLDTVLLLLSGETEEQLA